MTKPSAPPPLSPNPGNERPRRAAVDGPDKGQA
jgi:hypothetical protein